MIFRFIFIFTVTAIFLGGSFTYAPRAIAAPGTPGNNQVISSRDAIGLRVVPNPEHFSPLAWYGQSIKIKGAPQSLIVDGYEAVRDGRTVYVNAAKIVDVNRCVNNPAIICQSDNQCGIIHQNETRLPNYLIPTAWAAGECQPSTIPELYTNIYIISYNQDPEPATTDIFGQLLQYWKFNIDVKTCSNNPTQRCTADSDCEAACLEEPGQTCVCQLIGYCNQTKTKACLTDGDCPLNEYCNSKKSTIIRDTKRLADLRDVRDRLEIYNSIIRRYPVLDSGTYLTNRTVSTWPSWLGTFSSTLGSTLPTDPINKLGDCQGFEEQTCWNEQTKTFAGTADPLTLPAGSHAYYYQYKKVGNSYKFCSIVESGYIQGKAVNSEHCQTGRQCNRNCSGKQCGDDGCGGVCGTCAINQTCQNGICRNNSNIQTTH